MDRLLKILTFILTFGFLNLFQFGVRVVLKSWSEAMLSPERNWNPEEILEKLENYMTFLSLLQNDIFRDDAKVS